MKLSLFYRHMPVSQALSDFTTAKMNDRLKRFRGSPLQVRITFTVEHGEHSASAEVIAPDGTHIEAKHSGDDMYKAVDLLSQKLSRQLVRCKEMHQRNWGESLDALAPEEESDTAELEFQPAAQR